jgi:hypothetical protein
MNASAPKQETNMVNVSQFAASRFLKVADLQEHGGSIRATITAVEVNEKYKKLDIDLSDGSTLSCNATNTSRLIKAWGAESDDWLNREVELSVGETEYQGQSTETIIVTPLSPPPELPVVKTKKRGGARDDLDEEIGF